MNSRIILQPDTLLGNEIDTLLDTPVVHSRIVLVSAFVALRTILRLRDRLLLQVGNGASLRLTIGIDLGGTSREVLEELLHWNCETFIFHNPIVRATFHPKFYLFDTDARSTLFIGSNNLTDGGFYTNYEVATRYDFSFPKDLDEYENTIRPLDLFINPVGDTVQQLDADLIRILAERGQLLSEAAARRRNRRQTGDSSNVAAALPENPFSPVNITFPPLLSANLRPADTTGLRPPLPVPGQELPAVSPPDQRVLVWRKVLPRTDALQVNIGSHHVGGVRLTQARFENPQGQLIDQTTYFRQLFSDFDWEPEPRGYTDQEHAFVPMRIIIRGVDYGIRNFEISHKPSGEAGQANYTTILRWGRTFNQTIVNENLTRSTLSLYETDDDAIPFLIDITA